MSNKTVFDRVRARGEETVNKVLMDLLSNPTVADQVGKTVTRVVDVKRQADKNMQFVLGLLNLPSRADYSKLQSKVEALQGSLTNLSHKLDKIIEGQHPAPRKRAKK